MTNCTPASMASLKFIMVEPPEDQTGLPPNMQMTSAFFRS